MACRAVISAPEFVEASTTSTPSDMPLMMRLRCGNAPASGGLRGGDSLITAPAATIFSASSACSGGYMFNTPLPSTARVRPPAARAPRWAAASMPRARPLVIVTPARARLPARRSACASPYCVACREPTMATAIASRGRISPRTKRMPGGS